MENQLITIIEKGEGIKWILFKLPVETFEQLLKELWSTCLPLGYKEIRELKEEAFDKFTPHHWEIICSS